MDAGGRPRRGRGLSPINMKPEVGVVVAGALLQKVLGTASLFDVSLSGSPGTPE